jgi:hypothetical protein
LRWWRSAAALRQGIGYGWMFLLAGLAFLPVALCARRIRVTPKLQV